MSESAHQKALFEWAMHAQAKCPELAWLYHIPNGGKRDPKTAARLKAEGVKAGVPDLCLPVPRKGFHGLYIELKDVPTSCKATPAQLGWLAGLSALGYSTHVCHGWEAARDVLLEYLR